MEIGRQAIWNYDDHEGRALVVIDRDGHSYPWAHTYRVRVLAVLASSPIRRLKVGSVHEVSEAQLSDEQ